MNEQIQSIYRDRNLYLIGVLVAAQKPKQKPREKGKWDLELFRLFVSSSKLKSATSEEKKKEELDFGFQPIDLEICRREKETVSV